MAETIEQPSTLAKLGDVDDLKLIRGISHGVEARLHRAGIDNYARLAAASPNELADCLRTMVGFSAKRIEQLDWIGQARQLKLKKEQESQHYAGFTLEFLLDRDNEVRRTKIKYVQTQKKETWAGWDVSRLLEFIFENADIGLVAHSKGIPKVQLDTTNRDQDKSYKIEGRIARLHPDHKFAGSLRIGEIRVNAERVESISRFIPADTALMTRLYLDLGEASGLRGSTLSYSAMVFAKKWGDGGTQEIGQAEGSIELLDQPVINVPCVPLSGGPYQIEATVIISSSDKTSDMRLYLAGFGESELIQVI